MGCRIKGVGVVKLENSKEEEEKKQYWAQQFRMGQRNKSGWFDPDLMAKETKAHGKEKFRCALEQNREHQGPSDSRSDDPYLKAHGSTISLHVPELTVVYKIISAKKKHILIALARRLPSFDGGATTSEFKTPPFLKIIYKSEYPFLHSFQKSSLFLKKISKKHQIQV